jgi:uncharacterized membrane protein
MESPNRQTHLSSIVMVIICSFLGTTAQLLFKQTADRISAGWRAVFCNPYLFFGYVCYGFSTLLLMISLKKGQLSVLYPFIALTFVWVAILSPLVFPADTYNGLRLFGVFLIVVGVSFIGLSTRNEN